MLGLDKNYTPVLLVTGIFLVTNITIAEAVFIYDAHRIAQVLFVACLLIAYSCISGMPSGFARLSDRRSAAALLALSLAAISSCSAMYPAIAFKEVLNTLLLLALMFVMSFSSLRAASEQLVVIIGVGLLIYIFQMLVAFSAGVVSGTTIEREVIVHHISNIRFINHIQVLTLPLLLVFSLRSQFRLVRRLCAIAAVLSVSVLLFLSARAALGSLLIASVIFFVLKADNALIKRSVIIFLYGLVFYLFVFKLIPLMVFGAEIADVRVNLNSSGRWDMWVESLTIIKDNWLLGVGAMHYGYWSQYGFGHPHNLPLQIALEFGVPFFALVFFLLARFTLSLFKLYRIGVMNDFEVGCFWAFVAIGGVSLFSGVWVAPLTQLMLVVILSPLIGLIIRQSVAGEESRRAPSGNCARRGSIYFWFPRLVLIGAVGSLGLLVWDDVDARLSGKRIDPGMIEKPLYAPRFWQEDYWPARE